ncbi:hypothetical protein [Nocardiopsis prasina]|uniref:hypothetical protein n=1 Tax=Nocardiopsis prasina TaxID=2015 RepID=UPI00034B043B|nr:hypothetical protein [Nocardiopsis prasina]
MAKQPREYLRWDLLDRPDDPVPWQTSDVRTLSRFYERLSDAAEQAAADMRRLEGDSLGEGDTVAALKELVNELPKHLDKAQEAYEKGYRALDKWEISLGTARQDSASIAHQAASAYTALEDTDAWKKRVDGEDPERDAFITRLTSVLNDMDEAARECADALEEAKQGSPRKLWGWLDKIVTWVEENPLLYAVAMVVAGLAAIFIPGLGIALALTVLAISAASLHKEGKLGFNRESLFTLGMDAISLIPGGALLRGGRAVGRVAGAAATRVPGRVAGGVSRAASSVRSGASRAVPATVSRAANTTGGKIATSIAKDSAASMASSVTVQVAGEGKSLSDINWTNEALTAVGTSAAGSTVGVLADNGSLPNFFGGGSGSGGSADGSDPAAGAGGADPAGTQDSGGGGNTGAGGAATGEGRTGEASPDAALTDPDAGPAPMGGQGDPVPQQAGRGEAEPQAAAAQAGAGGPVPESAGAGAESGSTNAVGDSESGSGGAGAPVAAMGGPGDSVPAASADAGSAGGTPASTNVAGDSSTGTSGTSTAESDGRGDSSFAPDHGPTDTVGTGDSATGAADVPGPHDTGGNQSDRGDGTEPREDFAPPTRSGSGMNTPQPPASPRARIAEPGEVDVAPANRDGQPDTPSTGVRSNESTETRSGVDEPNPAPRSADQHPNTAEQRTPERAPGEAQPRQRAEDTQAPDAPRGDGSGASAQDGPVVTHTRTNGQGEFTTTRGADGEQNVAYRYPATREGGSDFTMNVTRDGVDVNGTSVRSTGRGFDVSSADGSSVRAQRDGTVRAGELEVTGPGGRGRASYRDGELTVSTSDGDVSVSRDTNGSEVRTGDGLTVRQDADGLRVSHTGDGPVDLRTNGGGPDVTRSAVDSTGRAPRSQVTDPTTGRNAEVGVDGYRVDVPGGGSHGFDRADGTVRVTSGGARAEVRSDSAHLSHADRGVDFDLRQDGTGSVRGGPSSAEIRADGGIDLRSSTHGDGNDAALRQVADGRGGTRPVFRSGNVTAEPGQVSFDHGSRVQIVDHHGTSAIHVVDGGRQRTYDMDGRPVPGETYPSLPLDPATNTPSLAVSSPDGRTLTSVTIEPGRGGDGPGAAPALRVESPYGWSVRASGDGDMTMAAPGGRENSLEVTRRGDGSVAVNTRDGSHRADNGGGRLSVSGPEGLRGDTDGDRVRVSDGEATTTARTDEGGVGPGERVAETRSDREPRPPFGESSQHENSVSTSAGTSVWARGDGVHTTMAPGRDPGTVSSGGRTVDVTPDGLTARGTGRDSDTWAVSTSPDGTRGSNGAQSIEVTARPGGPGVQNPIHTGNGRWPRLRDPLVSPDQIRFESGGNVSGTRSASGRAEVTDGSSGTTVRDARGGVRVDSGGGPELRVTEGHVRVSAPDGVQHRVDIPGSGADGAPARPDRDGGARTAPPMTDDGDAPARQDGDDTAQRDGDDTASGGDDRRDSPGPERPDPDPVTTLRDTRRAALDGIPFELFKNILNVVAGTGFDFARHFAAETTGLDWLSDGIAFGPDGMPNPSYVVQSFMQLGTAIPKAAAEGRYGGADGLPGFPLELSHQAMRNNLRDEYLDEFHEDFREGEKVEEQLEVLNKLLTEENLKEYEATRNTDHSNSSAVEEQERADRFLADAQAQRRVLEARLAKLYDVSLEDVEKMRDQG